MDCEQCGQRILNMHFMQGEDVRYFCSGDCRKLYREKQAEERDQ